jgi:hypothetical protein
MWQGARPGEETETGADEAAPHGENTAALRPGVLWPLLLYLLLSTVVMLPLCCKWHHDAVGGTDWFSHLCGIIEARNALKEGQFPIRVAPTLHGGIRYPLFQFYGQLPYLVPALPHLFGLDPWWACRLTLLGGLTLGAFFAYRCAWLLTGAYYPSLAAGTFFLAGPYLLTDIHARFAYTEVLAICSLPVVFWLALRVFRSGSVSSVLLGGVVWSLLALTHNITFLYASAFYGIFFGSYLLSGRGSFRGLLRLGVAYGLGLLLSAWYYAPHVAEMRNLRIGKEVTGVCGSPRFTNSLTPLWILLAPTMQSPPQSGTGRLGLQVGWPVLLGFGIVLSSLFSPRRGFATSRPLVVRVLVLFGAAFLLVWAPIDFWHYLPNVFCYVQFTYRLLAFTLLWGSFLVAFALTQVFGQAMTGQHLAACVLLAVLSMVPYLPEQPVVPSATGEALARIHHGYDNLDYVTGPYAVVRGTFRHDQANLAELAYWLDGRESQLRFRKFGYIPAAVRGDILRLEGRTLLASGSGVQVDLRLGERPLLRSMLRPGPFSLDIPIPVATGDRPAAFELRVLSAADVAAGKVAPIPGSLPLLELTRITLTRPGTKPIPPLLPAENLRPVSQLGRVTVCQVQVAERTLVQLPVLWYARLLEVRDNGKRVSFRNLGQFVALELEAGKHVLEVRFVGLRWATWVSTVAWLGVLAASLVLTVRQLRRGRERAVAPDNPDASADSLRRAA